MDNSMGRLRERMRLGRIQAILIGRCTRGRAWARPIIDMNLRPPFSDSPEIRLLLAGSFRDIPSEVRQPLAIFIEGYSRRFHANAAGTEILRVAVNSRLIGEDQLRDRSSIVVRCNVRRCAFSCGYGEQSENDLHERNMARRPGSSYSLSSPARSRATAGERSRASIWLPSSKLSSARNFKSAAYLVLTRRDTSPRR
jgi:hypothetical protein